jgi:hypothetical protein
MLALKGLNVPSLSVQDSIIVPGDRETLAREILSNLYKATTAAAPPHRYGGIADTVLRLPLRVTTGHPLARSCC